MPTVPTVGPQSRWLNLAFLLFDFTMAASVVIGVLMVLWMHRVGASLAVHNFSIFLVPASAVTWVWWAMVKHGIQQDMRRVRANESLRNGIPHHGVLMVVAVQSAVSISLWIGQVILSIRMDQQFSATIFGLANVITNVLLVGGMQIMTRVERGHLVTLDQPISAV